MINSNLQHIAEAEFGIVSGNLRSIEVSKMTGKVKEAASVIVKPKACYDNCFNLAHQLNVTYVLGVAFMSSIPYPIAHAWLKIDDQYIDPTLETVFEDIEHYSYLSLVEIPAKEILSVVDVVSKATGKGSFVPMIESIAHHPRWSNMFTNYGKRRIQYIN